MPLCLRVCEYYSGELFTFESPVCYCGIAARHWALLLTSLIHLFTNIVSNCDMLGPVLSPCNTVFLKKEIAFVL